MAAGGGDAALAAGGSLLAAGWADAVLGRAAVYEAEAQRLQALLSRRDTDLQRATQEAETGGGEIQRRRNELRNGIAAFNSNAERSNSCKPHKDNTCLANRSAAKCCRAKCSNRGPGCLLAASPVWTNVGKLQRVATGGNKTK